MDNIADLFSKMKQLCLTHMTGPLRLNESVFQGKTSDECSDLMDSHESTLKERSVSMLLSTNTFIHSPRTGVVCPCGLKDMEQQVKDAEIIIQAHDRRWCPSLLVVLIVVSNSGGCEEKQLKSEALPKHVRKARRKQKSRQRLRAKKSRQNPLVCLLR